MAQNVVYIMGCLGFIGSYITRICLRQGFQVRGVDKISRQSHEELLPEFQAYANFVFEKRDIRQLDYLYDCTYIINAAAETYIDAPIEQNMDFQESNVSSVFHLLELIRKFNHYEKPILIHLSTHEVYGNYSKTPYKETDLLSPITPFAVTKACADQMITAWSQYYKIPYLILRLSNNYGIGQHSGKLLPKACKFIQLGRKLPLHENGTPVRTWLHVEDTVDAIMKLMMMKVYNDVFNVSSDFSQQNIVTVQKVINQFFPEERNYNKYVDFSWTKIGKDAKYFIDDSKLRATGWLSRRNFDEELPRIVEYYRKNYVW